MGSPTVKFHFKKLSGAYSRDTDTLTIGNGNMAASAGEMAKGLSARYEEIREVAGFTLEWAEGMLLPLLPMWCASTAEELTTIRERMAADS